MKKRMKNKGSFTPKQDGQDIAGLILKVQQQLSFLERKIDALAGQSQEKPPERQHHTKPFQRFDRLHHQVGARRDNNFSQRVMHKAICADCNKECEVPFRPSQDRPVYCRDCFSKRKVGGPFKGKADHAPRGTEPAGISHGDRPHGDEKKRFYGKKRPAVKRRKTRE